jgi:hypothetical protein
MSCESHPNFVSPRPLVHAQQSRSTNGEFADLRARLQIRYATGFIVLRIPPPKANDGEHIAPDPVLQRLMNEISDRLEGSRAQAEWRR